MNSRAAFGRLFFGRLGVSLAHSHHQRRGAAAPVFPALQSHAVSFSGFEGGLISIALLTPRAPSQYSVTSARIFYPGSSRTAHRWRLQPSFRGSYAATTICCATRRFAPHSGPCLPSVCQTRYRFYEHPLRQRFNKSRCGVRQGAARYGLRRGQERWYRIQFAAGALDRLPEIANDPVSSRVKVIVAAGGANSALAAKAVSSTIPIVFVIGADPIKLGLAASLSRPGSNATGMTIFSAVLGPTRLESLRTRAKGNRFRGADQPQYPRRTCPGIGHDRGSSEPRARDSLAGSKQTGGNPKSIRHTCRG